MTTHCFRTAALAVATAALGALALVPTAAGARPRVDPGPVFQETNVGQVNGTYVPVVGRFSTTTSYDDILWYAPGAGAEQLWTNQGQYAFAKASLGNKVNGTYTPIVGDFTGDALDDILWYAPGAAADTLWATSGNATFTAVPVSISGTYTPVVLDDRAGDKDDIAWIKPGGASSVWSFTGTGANHASHSFTAPASAQPLTGDFDGDSHADLFWYGPGAIADSAWWGNGTGTFTVQAQSVGGTFSPVVGELTPFNGPTKVTQDPLADDIFWYRSTGSSAMWQGTPARTWVDTPNAGSIAGGATAIPLGYGNIFFWSTTKPDVLWSDGYIRSTNNTQPGTGYQAIAGNFYGAVQVLFYKPGPSPEIMFH